MQDNTSYNKQSTAISEPLTEAIFHRGFCNNKKFTRFSRLLNPVFHIVKWEKSFSKAILKWIYCIYQLSTSNFAWKKTAHLKLTRGGKKKEEKKTRKKKPRALRNILA